MEYKSGSQSQISLVPAFGWIISKEQKEISLKPELAGSFRIAFLDSLRKGKCIPLPTASPAMLGSELETTPNLVACRAVVMQWVALRGPHVEPGLRAHLS